MLYFTVYPLCSAFACKAPPEPVTTNSTLSPTILVKAGNEENTVALDADVIVNDLTAVRSDPYKDVLGTFIILCSIVFLPKPVTVLSKFIEAEVALATVTTKP